MMLKNGQFIFLVLLYCVLGCKIPKHNLFDDSIKILQQQNTNSFIYCSGEANILPIINRFSIDTVSFIKENDISIIDLEKYKVQDCQHYDEKQMQAKIMELNKFDSIMNQCLNAVIAKYEFQDVEQLVSENEVLYHKIFDSIITNNFNGIIPARDVLNLKGIYHSDKCLIINYSKSKIIKYWNTEIEGVIIFSIDKDKLKIERILERIF